MPSFTNLNIQSWHDKYYLLIHALLTAPGDAVLQIHTVNNPLLTFGAMIRQVIVDCIDRYIVLDSSLPKDALSTFILTRKFSCQNGYFTVRHKRATLTKFFTCTYDCNTFAITPWVEGIAPPQDVPAATMFSGGLGSIKTLFTPEVFTALCVLHDANVLTQPSVLTKSPLNMPDHSNFTNIAITQDGETLTII